MTRPDKRWFVLDQTGRCWEISGRRRGHIELRSGDETMVRSSAWVRRWTIPLTAEEAKRVAT